MLTYVFNLDPNPATLTKPEHHEVHRETPSLLGLGALAALPRGALDRDCLPTKVEHRHVFFAENDVQAMEIAKGLAEALGRVADGCYWCMNKYHKM